MMCVKRREDSHRRELLRFLIAEFHKLQEGFETEEPVILRYVWPLPGDAGEEHGFRLYLPFGKNPEIVEPAILALIRLMLGEGCPEDKQSIYEAWARLTTETLISHAMIAEFLGIKKDGVDENVDDTIARYIRNARFLVIRDSISVCQAMLGPEPVQTPESVQTKKQAKYPAAKWEDISMLVFNKQTVQITIAGKSPVNCGYAELGMADGRSKTKNAPVAAWSALLALAEHSGRFPAGEERARSVGRRGAAPAGIIESEAKEAIRAYREEKKNVRKNIQDLRNRLRELFGLDSDPIPFDSDNTYRQAKFRIRVGPDYASE